MHHMTLFTALLAACLTLANLSLSAADPTSLGASAAAKRTWNVLDCGAAGDGVTLDTDPVQQALDQCAQAGGGQVRVPTGRFLTGTLRLRSHVTLYLEAGAVLVGTTNLGAYAAPAVPAFMPEARWGKWHRGLLIGENLEGAAIAGQGTIDGHRVFDPTGEERMRGPHALVFVNCRGFSIRDVSFVDAANYAVFFQVSDEVDIVNVTFTGGWDGVHFRGSPSRWCRQVQIVNCRFFTGDDAIAGRYWDNVLIRNCIINSSCNGIRLIGPATHLVVNACLFNGPGRQPHRSSNRTNMLSGIILQPGAWDATEGLLDEVLLADNTMLNVASPVTLWTKPGNTVGRVEISGLNASGVYRAAVSAESWAAQPITNVVLRHAQIEFDGGGTLQQSQLEVKGPGVDARTLPAWGLYARNVQHLSLEDVRFSLRRPDLRPVIHAQQVQTLDLDSVRFPAVEGVTNTVRLDQVGTVNRH